MTRSSWSRRGGLVALLPAALVLSGCSMTGDSTGAQAVRLGWPDPITEEAEQMLGIYVGSWIAALAVGLFVWGLIFIAMIRYRRKDDVLPRQVRYNLPVEVLYTVVPFVIVAVLFYWTAVIQEDVVDLSDDPDVQIGVVGFQWNWQFSYLQEQADGDDADSEPDLVPVAEIVGRPGQPAVLTLPSDRTVRFIETSPDVIHSFWVPEFLFKRDVIPGRENQFEVTMSPDAEGVYVGRCAELCGVDHSRMNFELRVVSPEEYEQYLADAVGAGGRLQGTSDSPAAGGDVNALGATAETG